MSSVKNSPPRRFTSRPKPNYPRALGAGALLLANACLQETGTSGDVLPPYVSAGSGGADSGGAAASAGSNQAGEAGLAGSQELGHAAAAGGPSAPSSSEHAGAAGSGGSDEP